MFSALQEKFNEHIREEDAFIRWTRCQMNLEKEEEK
jgi:hypothetical protein